MFGDLLGGALQTNAANLRQRNFAHRVEKRRAARRSTLLRAQLATVEGREFVWGELERHGIYDLVTGAADAVYPFLGRRQAGIELLQELMRDHPTFYLQMQAEAVERVAREQREIAAIIEATAKETAE